MVGIFSRFYSSKGGHRRTQSAVDESEVWPPSLESRSAATLATSVSVAVHSVEVALELKPIEHPMEPLDLDQPIQCPLPQPSMLSDQEAPIWKEQSSSRKADVPISQASKSETTCVGPLSKTTIVPSMSAPELEILKLLELEECKASAV